MKHGLFAQAVVADEFAPSVSARDRSESMWAQTSRRLKRSHTAVFGLSVVVCLLLVALLADVLAPYSATSTNPE